MADIDLTNMSVNELQDLINKASDAKFHAEHLAQDEAVARKARIQAAAASLQGLLGPEGAPAAMDSIRGVLAFGEDVIKTNPGQAVFLSLQGMEILTNTVLDLAKPIAEA